MSGGGPLYPLFNRPFNTQIRFKFDLLKLPYLRFLKRNNEILWTHIWKINKHSFYFKAKISHKILSDKKLSGFVYIVPSCTSFSTSMHRLSKDRKDMFPVGALFSILHFNYMYPRPHTRLLAVTQPPKHKFSSHQKII